VSNEELYDAAMDAISKLFSDRTVTKTETRENLNNLISEMEVMIDTLGEDE
jgi:hypothetical protein